VTSSTTISPSKQWPAAQPSACQNSGQLYNHQLIKVVASCTTISLSKQWPAVQPSARQSSGQLYNCQLVKAVASYQLVKAVARCTSLIICLTMSSCYKSPHPPQNTTPQAT